MSEHPRAWPGGQVLEEGRGLTEQQTLRCLQLPDEPPGRAAGAGPRGADALVRPEVEVEGIVSA